jgi:type VI secretion system secreted protein Hcp
MALDAYLQLDGIKGEATEANHKDWIQLTQIGHAIEQQASKNPPGGQKATTANSKHSAIQIGKKVDKATPLLHAQCCSGKTITKATIDLLKDAGDKRVVYLKYELTNVIIAGVNVSADQSHAEEPDETVQLKYGTIKWTYQTTDPGTGAVTGNVPAGWDLGTNAKLAG